MTETPEVNGVLEGARHRAFIALSRYWATGGEIIRNLPIVVANSELPERLPPQLEMVPLPDWADDISVSGGLLVPSASIVPGEGPAFSRTDWWFAAAWYLDGYAERAFEAAHGPVHSYSVRLVGWDTRMWERAWVNRIALWMRRLASFTHGCDETRAFGRVPPADVQLTHDVDAVRKTFRIRFKQGSFNIFNAARALGRGEVACAARATARGIRFATQPGDYWTFDRLCSLEEARGLRSIFHVYAGAASTASRSVRLLFDPAYRAGDPAIVEMVRSLHRRGWEIGLHQSFATWADPDEMRRQREVLEDSLGSPVTSCRQHWLRFSWASTWTAQEAAGLELDTTLGFNDRPGFRNGAALRVSPLDPSGRPLRLASLPLVLMDSHLYDYADPCHRDPEGGIARWIHEIRAVGGCASVLWHPHVLSRDYGWAPGYEELLGAIA